MVPRVCNSRSTSRARSRHCGTPRGRKPAKKPERVDAPDGPARQCSKGGPSCDCQTIPERRMCRGSRGSLDGIGLAVCFPCRVQGGRMVRNAHGEPLSPSQTATRRTFIQTVPVVKHPNNNPGHAGGNRREHTPAQKGRTLRTASRKPTASHCNTVHTNSIKCIKPRTDWPLLPILPLKSSTWGPLSGLSNFRRRHPYCSFRCLF